MAHEILAEACEGRMRPDSVQPMGVDYSFMAAGTTGQPPQGNQGVLLPEEWQFNHGIAAMGDPEKPEKIKHIGEIVTQTVLMEDGSLYRIHDGTPYHQKVDQGSLKATPFLIVDDLGFTRHHQIKDLESGIRSLVISRPQSWEGKLSQARTAHDMLRITKEVFTDAKRGEVDPVNIEARGISRAAMLAIMAKALAEAKPDDYGLIIFYFSALAPCFPRPLRPTPNYLKFPITEPASLLYHLGKLPINTLLHYPKSIDKDREFAWQESKALTNGDAGKAVKFIPKDPDLTHGYVLAYPDDTMGMGKVWKRDFKNHDGVYVHLEKPKLPRIFDGHLRVVSVSDLAQELARQDRLKEESKRTVGNLQDIDFEYVNGRAA